MTLEELNILSNKLTYKGNRCFRVEHRDWRNGFAPCPEGYVYIAIWIHAVCVITGKTTRIESGGLSAIKDIEHISEMSEITNIRDIIMTLEMHEVNETLALDEKRIFNPHANRVVVQIEEEKVA